MKIFWLDIESTGLSPERDALLELAIAEADLERPFDTYGPARDWVFQFEEWRYVSPFVRDMHTRNGLFAECAQSTTTVQEIEDHLLTVVPEVTGDDKPTLAGSTVHFDHGFLRVHMPRLAARFSHRHYDVSAVKLFCRSLGMPKPPKAEAHRATADVLESIAHARLCAEWLRTKQPWERQPWELPKGSPSVMPSFPCKACDGHGFVMVNAHGPQEMTCEDCCGSGEIGSPAECPAGCVGRPFGGGPCSIEAHNIPGIEAAPDAHCVTTPDGGCVSEDPADMHRLKGSL